MTTTSSSIKNAENQKTKIEYPPITQSPDDSIIQSPPHPFLPPASLTLLIGNPGIGKSLLATHIAAQLSQGLPPLPPLTPNLPPLTPNPSPLTPDPSPLTPDPSPLTPNPSPLTPDPSPLTPDPSPLTPPQISLLSSSEDSTSTLHSRLHAANAHLPNILLLPPKLSLVPQKPAPSSSLSTLATDHWPLTTPTLLRFLELILHKLQKQNQSPSLLILDPLPHFLGTFDCTNAATIRRILTPLLQLAQQHNFSILGITHLNKSSPSNSPLHRALNSIAYIALARSVLLLTPDDTDPTNNRRLLIPLKSNLTKPTHALAFSITDTNSPPLETRNMKLETPLSPTLLWHPPIPHHPLLNAHTTPPTPIEHSQLELATTFLKTTLQPGPLPSATLLKQARAIGLSQRTLNRARHQLKVSCYYDQPSNQWLSALPP